MSSTYRARRQSFVVAILALATLVVAPPGRAQTPAGVAEYIVPFDEDVFAYATERVANATIGATTTSRATIDVTAWSNTIRVYYDHWENGYGSTPLTLTARRRGLRPERRADAQLPERGHPAASHRRRRQHLRRSGGQLHRPGTAGNPGQPDDARLLLRRPRPLRHRRRRDHGDARRLARRATDYHAADRRGGLPARAAAHQVRPAVRRGRDPRRLRARRGGHPGDRGRHDDPDRLQRGRHLRLLQHRERLPDRTSRPDRRDDPDAAEGRVLRPRPGQRRDRRHAVPGAS